MISKACYVAAYRRKLELMAAQGVDLHLIVPPYWRFGSRKAPLEPGNDRGYELIVENPVFNGRHHFHFYPRLGRWLDRIRPDIVHIDEEPYDLVAFQALRVAKRRGARIVFFTWQNLDRDFPYPFRVIERWVLNGADAAVAGNRDGEAVLRRKGFRGPIDVIPQFGVDEERFSPAGKGNNAAIFQVGYVGRLVPEKGVFDLLEACTGLDFDWRLRFVGAGPAEAKLREKCRSLGVEDRVEIGGGVPSDEVPGILTQLDCLVLPSLSTPIWKEQFGRVLIEAMACEVAVVANDSGEIPNVVGDGGIIVAEGDIEALRAAIGKLRRDPDERRRLARRGRERVLAHFTQRHIAGETVALYERMLGGAVRTPKIEEASE